MSRTPDLRTATELDCDRILYSDELRRLGGVTQTVAVGETPLFHTRLTHTLKVQQLARRLAEHLSRDSAQASKLAAIGGIDVSAAEAAGLAHDLGHPPFGHVGEAVLNEHCERHSLDGYEGNAQTFRILTKLALRSDVPRGEGLGISDITLRAVIKYPHLRTGEHEGVGKWNAYPTESKVFAKVRKGLGKGKRTIEAEIMDWADDVTYAVHDLEDFIRAQHVPVAALAGNPEERRRFIETSWPRVQKKVPKADHDRAVEAFEGRLLLLCGTLYTQRDLQFSVDLMRGCDLLINEYVSNATVGNPGGPLLHIPPNLRAEVELFKQLTWYYVIFDPRLASLQEGHKRVVAALFETLHRLLKAADEDKVLSRLPRRLQWAFTLTKLEQGSEQYLSLDARYARAVADYIASLTEAQAVDLYQRLISPGGRSVLDPWMIY